MSKKLLTIGNLKKFIDNNKLTDDTVICIAMIKDDCVENRLDIYEEDLDADGHLTLGDHFIDININC